MSAKSTELQGPLIAKDSLMAGVRELSARDADLAEIVSRLGPPPLWARRPGFATLLRIIFEQQVSLASADATYARLQNALGRVTAARVARLRLGELQRLGITRQKAAYCHGLARQVVSGKLNLGELSRADDSKVRRSLLALRGIGPWTADIYLLMALRRPDIWPEGDLALAKAVRRLKRLRSEARPDRVRRMAVAWRPWRSVAARMLWHMYLKEGRVASAGDHRTRR